MKLDLNDPKIALIHRALIEVLAKHDVSKISHYFTDNAIMILNEKKLQRHEIDHRIAWVKDNVQCVKVTLHNAFFNGDQGFDHHTTEIVQKDGKRSIFKIFGYIELQNGKISRYEDVTLQVEGEKAMEVVTSTSKIQHTSSSTASLGE